MPIDDAAPARSRNAAATRAAILASARSAFARAGYDGAGVREIAAGAGVTAMLVNRYFGSKEQLFAEVVAATMADPVILTDDFVRAPTGEAIARRLVGLSGADQTPLDGFLVMFHSASSRRAAEISREQIEAIHQRAMASALGGDLAAERAAVILAIVAGVQVMRQMIALPTLANADPEALVAILAPVFQALIDGVR
ncbi:transcriptional regulator [Caulobacter sp. AP07]|uniref:TetR/AcrR family transcriptional regulator n=1 Tax=Caulobacter sp. AP07 TaxID=1144304 RepID=UPI000272259A|nr:TetR/AcrR family transcriptional regulator [Caulobacter sp. AP07]EJL26746.1 transcriptional regulator [Caulobacter sp. AP07]